MASHPAARLPRFRDQPAVDVPAGTPERLASFLASHRRVVAITGAGCSTGSGIPAYRDGAGQWQRRTPIFYQDFLHDPAARRRYWARSFFGWAAMRSARPGTAHRVLARLAGAGRLHGLITQNVDGLHQRAGHPDVLELHGGLDRVLCLDCGGRVGRRELQQRLDALNPDWAPDVLGVNPDGDAELDERAYPGFRIAECRNCGGRLKPDVVFFGESVPRARLEAADRLIDTAGAVLIIGSSMVVWSGFRLARRAAQRGVPVVAVNEGLTRADGLLQFKLGGDCGKALKRTESLLVQASGA